MNERLQGLRSLIFPLVDPTADEVFPLWRAPMACDLAAIYVITRTAFTANSTDYLTMTFQDGGQAPKYAATPTIAARGGSKVAWVADSVYQVSNSTFTSSAPWPLDSGDVVKENWNEEGTVALIHSVQLDWVPGQRGTT